MSGIAGIYSADGRPADLNILDRMTDVMSARGPDGEGHWNGVGVALGHRMLRATPESRREAQPLCDDAGGLSLTLDGRLDNRDELIALLEAEGLRDQTDAELILRAYQKWGEQCPKKLLGDFAFAISDKRRQQLFCARDHLGLRPFYYHSDGSRVIFASEIQALFEDRTVVRRPNLISLGCHLMDLSTAPRDTLYEGVYRLPAGHSMVVNREGLRESRYWDIDPANEIRYRADADYYEHFLALFQRAESCRLRTTGAVAILLSGGLDSGAVFCTARQLLREGLTDAKRLETFSITFEGFPASDERDYIAKVLAGPNASANFVSFQEGASWLTSITPGDFLTSSTIW
jgi:asparagine synthase (glutamine-hydrolysing)